MLYTVEVSTNDGRTWTPKSRHTFLSAAIDAIPLGDMSAGDRCRIVNQRGKVTEREGTKLTWTQGGIRPIPEMRG